MEHENSTANKVESPKNNALTISPLPPNDVQNLTFSVCIDNYNYAEFISKSIESCLRLNKNLLKEIVIVDDGSTDNSREVILSYRQKYPDIIKTVFQENGGQLAALKAGIKNTSGDIICLLDSDDYYLAPDYLDNLKMLYEQKPYIDMVFCELLRYKYNETISKLPEDYPDVDYGTNKYICTYKPQWVGRETSTISIRKNYAKIIADMPDSFDDSWKIRADDVFIFASSVLGAHKYFYNKTQVGYLVHENNNFYGKTQQFDDKEYNDKRFDNTKKLVNYFSTISGSRKPAAAKMYEESLKIPVNKYLLKVYAKLFLKRPNINIFYFLKTVIRYILCTEK